MPLEFMTREVFDALIIAVIVIGVAWAAVRLYRDFTRPLPPVDAPHGLDDDTQPRRISPDDPGGRASASRRKNRN